MAVGAGVLGGSDGAGVGGAGVGVPGVAVGAGVLGGAVGAGVSGAGVGVSDGAGVGAVDPPCHLHTAVVQSFSFICLTHVCW